MASRRHISVDDKGHISGIGHFADRDAVVGQLRAVILLRRIAALFIILPEGKDPRDLPGFRIIGPEISVQFKRRRQLIIARPVIHISGLDAQIQPVR